jgi:hypothetical protein
LKKRRTPKVGFKRRKKVVGGVLVPLRRNKKRKLHAWKSKITEQLTHVPEDIELRV